MSRLPKIAIIGRPNVGKSALFNSICRRRVAIVDEAEGITRDRLYAEGEFFGRPFEVIDTGGIDIRAKAPYSSQVKQQAEIAMEEADSIILVVDSQVGITPLDAEVAQMVLKKQKPVCVAVNKIDHPSQEWQIHTCQLLGIKDIVAVSAAQSWHIAELLEAALKPIPEDSDGAETDAAGIKVAIVGRPNVGKSSLLNYLLAEERCIVSPLAGTTRDSIDIPFLFEGNPYTLIDTAGIRRKNAEKEVVDKFAAIRTARAIERADICILMLDAQQGMTAQEKRIATDIEEAGKGCLLLFNKWDLVKGFRMEHCLRGIEEEVPFLRHCPKLFISAQSGRNVEKIFAHIKEIHAAMQQRVSTHQLNKCVSSALQKNHPPMIEGKRLRIYYLAQVGTAPPTFVLFVNRIDLMRESYKKYLINQLRAAYPFTGCPLKFYLRGKEERQRPAPQKISADDKQSRQLGLLPDEHLAEDDDSDMALDSSWYS